MADKLLGTGHLGLTNYRSRLSRPMMGVVSATRSRQAMLRARSTRPFNSDYQIRQIVEDSYPPYLANVASQYLPTQSKNKRRKQYRPKRKCCRWYRGKKYCSPRFCSKKYYW